MQRQEDVWESMKVLISLEKDAKSEPKNPKGAKSEPKGNRKVPKVSHLEAQGYQKPRGDQNASEN